MDKRYSSREQRCGRNRRTRILFSLAVVACIAAGLKTLPGVTISHSDALRIGKRIWQNECNGTIAGLTSWNEGENFASLGIGHFIWYPKDQRGPFEESFPKLISFVSSRGAKLPNLLSEAGYQPCPWNSRAEFLHAQHTTEMNQLRSSLPIRLLFRQNSLSHACKTRCPKCWRKPRPLIVKTCSNNSIACRERHRAATSSPIMLISRGKESCTQSGIKARDGVSFRSWKACATRLTAQPQSTNLLARQRRF